MWSAGFDTRASTRSSLADGSTRSSSASPCPPTTRTSTASQARVKSYTAAAVRSTAADVADRPVVHTAMMASRVMRLWRRPFAEQPRLAASQPC